MNIPYPQILIKTNLFLNKMIIVYLRVIINYFIRKIPLKKKKENKLEIIIKSQFPTNKTSEDIENIEENIFLNVKNI